MFLNQNLDYRDVFSNELPAAPAKIPEFTLDIRKIKWEVAKNRAPPRSQSASKQTALFSTVETLLRQGIITKFSSPYYSQVFLVPKPDKTFRMCADYKALNDCIPDANWPIPNYGFDTGLSPSTPRRQHKGIYCIYYLFWGI